jgi:hypothetical protein
MLVAHMRPDRRSESQCMCARIIIGIGHLYGLQKEREREEQRMRGAVDAMWWKDYGTVPVWGYGLCTAVQSKLQAKYLTSYSERLIRTYARGRWRVPGIYPCGQAVPTALAL